MANGSESFVVNVTFGSRFLWFYYISVFLNKINFPMSTYICIFLFLCSNSQYQDPMNGPDSKTPFMKSKPTPRLTLAKSALQKCLLLSYLLVNLALRRAVFDYFESSFVTEMRKRSSQVRTQIEIDLISNQSRQSSFAPIGSTIKTKRKRVIPRFELVAYFSLPRSLLWLHCILGSDWLIAAHLCCD